MIRPMRPIAAIGLLTALSACTSSNTPTAQQQYQAFAQNQRGVDPSRISQAGSKQVRNVGGNLGINTPPVTTETASNTGMTGAFCFPYDMTCGGGSDSSGGYSSGLKRYSEKSRPIEVERDGSRKRDEKEEDASIDKKEKKNKPTPVAEEALTILVNKENAMNIFSRLNLRADVKLSIKNETSYPDSNVSVWEELASKSSGQRIASQFADLKDAGAFDITRRWGINNICVRAPDPTKIDTLFKEDPTKGKDKKGNVILLTVKDVCSYTCFTSFSRPSAVALKVTPGLLKDANVVVGSKAEEVADQIDAYMAEMESQIANGPTAATIYTFDDQKKPVYANVNSKTGNGSVTSNANLPTMQVVYEKKAKKFKDLTQEQDSYFKTHSKDQALYELLILAGRTDKLGNWNRIEIDAAKKSNVRDLSVRSSNDMIACKWTIPVTEAEKILRAIKPEYGAYMAAKEENKGLNGFKPKDIKRGIELNKVQKEDATLSGSDREQFFLNAFIAGDVTCFFQIDPNSKVIPITGTPSLITQ